MKVKAERHYIHPPSMGDDNGRISNYFVVRYKQFPFPWWTTLDRFWRDEVTTWLFDSLDEASAVAMTLDESTLRAIKKKNKEELRAFNIARDESIRAAKAEVRVFDR